LGDSRFYIQVTKQTTDNKILVNHVADIKSFNKLIFHNYCDLTGGQVFRQRRSALDFQGEIAIRKDQLYSILEKVTPSLAKVNSIYFQGTSNFIQLGIIVRNVEGLEPGLYVLVRNITLLEELKNKFKSDFEWKCIAESLPFFLLKTAVSNNEIHALAYNISCHQGVAGNSSVTFIMLSKFSAAILEDVTLYRRMHWEAGLIGQVIHYEAEAMGFRGTGMGCYFDLDSKSVLGVEDNSYEIVYHFAVGHAIPDPRLHLLQEES